MAKFERIKKSLKEKKKGSEPKDKELYSRVKSEAKKKFEKFPSAYASGWIVREYKKRGGKYS